MRHTAPAAKRGEAGSRAGFGTWLPLAALNRRTGPLAPDLDRVAARADLIIVQSGQATTLIPRLRRRAPQAALVYFATESLGLIDGRDQATSMRGLRLVDGAVAIRPALRRDLSRFVDPVLAFSPPVDGGPHAAITPSPYPAGRNVAVIGGGWLDPVTIAIAAAADPASVFYPLGSLDADLPANVRVLDRLAPADVVPFLIHADAVLVAGGPADETPDGILLATWLALLAQRGVPTVCSDADWADHPRCYGFDPGRSASLRASLSTALSARPKKLAVVPPDWDDLAHRLAGDAGIRTRFRGPAEARRIARAG